MSKFNVTVRPKGNGIHVGINVKHWQDFSAALKAAAAQVADLVYSGRLLARKPPEPATAEKVPDDSGEEESTP